MTRQEQINTLVSVFIITVLSAIVGITIGTIVANKENEARGNRNTVTAIKCYQAVQLGKDAELIYNPSDKKFTCEIK